MKITYLLIAHKLPGQLARLLNALDGEDVGFVIHIDRKSDEAAFRKLCAGKNVRWVTNRVRVQWGGFSQVEATMNSLREALQHFPSSDYFIYLSGQDFPVKPHARRMDFFREANGKSFLEYFPLPSPSWAGNGGLDRMRKRHYNDLRGKLLRRVVTRIAHLLPARKFPEGWKPFGGGCYFALTNKHAGHLLKISREEKWKLRFFRRALCPDELVVQTVLLSTIGPEQFVSDNLHLIHWQPLQRNPDVITVSHFSSLAAARALFARKFDETIDPEILDRVEKELLK